MFRPRGPSSAKKLRSSHVYKFISTKGNGKDRKWNEKEENKIEKIYIIETIEKIVSC